MFFARVFKLTACTPFLAEAIEFHVIMVQMSSRIWCTNTLKITNGARMWHIDSCFTTIGARMWCIGSFLTTGGARMWCIGSFFTTNGARMWCIGSILSTIGGAPMWCIGLLLTTDGAKMWCINSFFDYQWSQNVMYWPGLDQGWRCSLLQCKLQLEIVNTPMIIIIIIQCLPRGPATWMDCFW
jgi:hypothetical protein